MFSNPKFQTFYETYSDIKDNDEALSLLKDFMFSLPTDEMVGFMLETGQAHNEAVASYLSSETTTHVELTEFHRQFNDLLSAFAAPASLSQAA